jgi:aspartate/methionine/tyrosine aminotransferase
MPLDEFDLEVYFAKYEFSAKFLLCSSDAQTIKMKTLLQIADEESLSLWNNLDLGYTEAPGLPVLREEVAKNYEGLGADNILMFAGAEEAIYATMRSLLKPDDHVVCILPAYQSLYSVAADVVGKSNCKGIDLEDIDGKWCFPMKRLRKVINSRTKMLVMNFPHNPTGAMITAEEQKELVEIAREHDLWIFFDEVYRGLELDTADRLPQMATMYEKAFSLGVMSKSLGLPGLRVGWLASKDSASLSEIANYKHYLSICNSAPSEVLSLMALRCQDKLLNRIHNIIAKNLTLIDAFLVEFADMFTWNPPLAGCIGLMTLKGDVDIDTFAGKMMEFGSVMLLPGHLFPSATPGGATTRNSFRFGFGRENFPEALEVFKRAIRRFRADGGCQIA